MRIVTSPQEIVIGHWVGRVGRAWGSGSDEGFFWQPLSLEVAPMSFCVTLRDSSMVNFYVGVCSRAWLVACGRLRPRSAS